MEVLLASLMCSALTAKAEIHMFGWGSESLELTEDYISVVD